MESSGVFGCRWIDKDTCISMAGATVWSPSYKENACSQMLISPCLWKTGYDTTQTLARHKRMFVPNASKNKVQNAVKFCLLWWSFDELSQQKTSYIERGSECVAKTFHSSLKSALTMKNHDTGSAEYAKVKPHKVIGAMKVFLRPTLQHRCLESGEVPVNVKIRWEALAMVRNRAYSWRSSSRCFSTRWSSTNLPYICECSVSAKLFQENTCLCDRAQAVVFFVRSVLHGLDQLKLIKDGETAAREWLRTTGFENIDELNKGSSNSNDFMDWTCRSIKLV